jgi:glycosyltransferase involved in cell wall biosynthesis
LAQEFVDYECVIVDDGGTAPVVVPDDPRLRVVRHPENLGVARALNTGLEAARGDHVTFLDDDDELTPDRLAMIVPALGTGDVVVCWARADGDPQPVNRVLEGSVYDTILDSFAPPKGTVVLPRDRAPRFDPRYRALEDLDWWLRVAAAFDVATVPRVGYLIHQHGGRRGTNGDEARLRCGQLLLEEHSDYFRVHRKATALRWRMIGVAAMNVGDRTTARRAFARSLRAAPTRRTLLRFARSMAP